MNNENTENRVLGRALSLEELEMVSGGTTTPASDGCADDDGNDVECKPF